MLIFGFGLILVFLCLLRQYIGLLRFRRYFISVMGQKWVENKVFGKNYLSPDFNMGKLNDASPEFFSKKLGWMNPFANKKKLKAKLCGP